MHVMQQVKKLALIVMDTEWLDAQLAAEAESKHITVKSICAVPAMVQEKFCVQPVMEEKL